MFNIAIGIVSGLLFVCLIVLFSTVLIKSYSKRVQKQTQLMFQKDLDYQKAVNSAIVETQEQVLKNIALELHDDVGQQLTSLNYQIEFMLLDASQNKDKLQAVSEAVKTVSTTVRSLSHSMTHQLFSKQDLLTAISLEVKRLQEFQKCTLLLELQEQAVRTFTTNEKIFIYRIFQESLNNVFKHAQADLVTISIKTSPYFEMTISDDGIGFDSAAAMTKAVTFGIQSMKERAAFLNLRFELRAAPNKGTTVHISEQQETH